MARPESLQWAWSSAASAAHPRLPERVLAGSLERGQPVCSTTTVRSAQSPRVAAAALEQVGVRHQVEHEAALLECPQDLRGRRCLRGRSPSCGRPGSVTRSSGRRAARVPRRPVCSERMPPMIAAGWPVASAISSRSRVSSAMKPPAAETCTTLSTGQARTRPGTCRGRTAGTSLRCRRCRALGRPTGTGTNRCGRGPRSGRGHRRCARSARPSFPSQSPPPNSPVTILRTAPPSHSGSSGPP